MRYLLAIILTMVPLVTVGWIGWRAKHPSNTESTVGQPSTPTSSAGGTALGTAAAPVSPANEDASLLALFSGPLAGVKVKEQVVLYDSQKLFEYIDGAAPIFLERHFRKLAAAEMTTAQGSDLTCDIYDMSTPQDAESIFVKERSPSARPVASWPEAIAGSMSFVFRAGRYYVKLTAFDARSEAVLPELARALKEKIP